MANDLVILNIGLSAPTFMKAKPLSHVERLAIMRKRLPLFMNIHSYRHEIVPRHVYGGEPVAIVSGTMSTSPWTGYLRNQSQAYLLDMLIEMEQDCCAMLNYRTGKGELVGLYADRWGTFNRDYFVM
ncbi:hypothetical protein EGC79_20470 [Shewanella vesiculosa]|uniref:Uncharacterized protein n=1 Tax=Curvibacter phage P26059B TaxID=1983784 RepID=A0A384UH64_9CAUD|nr:hypothetical protein [Shewanella vesiculosa]YP_009811799.1 hypothetical protein HOU10_gp37 [Curvibacter phage P26059B]ASJ79313.1 hypothetical protein P26059B_0037 [Curvibacter phage P26059B]RPA32796.1 hypothetical protein EGC79_20470 [Shewanella vesiculosa]